MKWPKLGVLLLITLIVGFLAGGFLGSRLTGREAVKSLHVVLLSDAAFRAGQYTQWLKEIRAGNQDCVNERLESSLDFALVELAGEYAPERDYYGLASKSIAEAREYRDVYPRKSTLARVDQEVASALRINQPVEQK